MFSFIAVKYIPMNLHNLSFCFLLVFVCNGGFCILVVVVGLSFVRCLVGFSERYIWERPWLWSPLDTSVGGEYIDTQCWRAKGTQSWNRRLYTLKKASLEHLCPLTHHPPRHPKTYTYNFKINTIKFLWILVSKLFCLFF